MPLSPFEAHSVSPFNQQQFLAFVREQAALGRIDMDEEQIATLRVLLVDASEGQAWLLTRDGVACGFAVCGFLLSVAVQGRIAVFDYLEVTAREEALLAWATLLAQIEDDLQTLDIHQMVLEVRSGEADKHQVMDQRDYSPSEPLVMRKPLRGNRDFKVRL
ncbi:MULTISPECIES: hypothetical protein [Pseudovibrio]|uniref:hypothetical protein n=1 Tax=Stappiaceae TaxID=2821832 RepID=UPI0023656E6A|nr:MULTISPECIES: hypothetical protein [Pseudovibrio]MDD7911318.1 hypothetical protein [Pseudovibrio exalbescens]MDX5592995.1 hypothetical protein [Pseudovibrio sp. SPO723]